jgi:hypothetical protein
MPVHSPERGSVGIVIEDPSLTFAPIGTRKAIPAKATRSD